MPNRVGLTPQQERFAQLVAKGNNYSVAYRTAYNAEGMADNSLNQLASRLAANVKVRDRIDHLQEEMAQTMLADGALVREYVRNRLKIEAENSKSDAVRVRALELLGKMDYVGLFKERVEQADNRSAADIKAELERRLSGFIRAEMATPAGQIEQRTETKSKE
jgi:phage terminase small subunit